ncbi:MAG: T9SS type A sorting domain-containing protein, partial [Flavobacteriales bacterium]
MRPLLHLGLIFGSLLPHLAMAQFGPATLITDQVSASALKTADLDGDGDQDIVVPQGSALVWMENDGLGNFGQPDTILPQFSGPFDLSDLNDDDDPDLVVIVGIGHDLVWCTNLGGGQFGLPQLISTTTQWFGLGALLCDDLTGDGLPEVLITTDNFIRWFVNAGGNFTQTDSLDYGGPASPVLLAGDMDMDGDEDLITVNWNNFLRVGLNTDGTGSMGPSDIVLMNFEYLNAGMQLVDMDGDGDLDVVDAKNEVKWARNRFVEDGVWGGFDNIGLITLQGGGAPTYDVGWAGHLGCGSSASIIWQTYMWDGPVQWSNYDQGDGALTAPADLMDPFRVLHIDVADLNGDGAGDLILSERDTSLMWWYPNLLQQVSTITVSLAPFDTLCASGDPYPLDHATPQGGIWTGLDVAGNVFTASATGMFALTYTVSDPLGGCPGTAAQNIEVVGTPQITLISGVLGDDCAVSPLVYAADPGGGTWSGIADPDGVVDRSCAARPDSGPVLYSFNAANGVCAAEGDYFNLLACLFYSMGPDVQSCTTDDILTFTWTLPSVDVSGPFDSVVVVTPTSAAGYFDPAHGPGTYEFIGSAYSPGTCTIPDTLLVTVYICTGLGDPASASPALNIFPNPANGIVRITCPANAKLRLLDAAGRTVWEVAKARSETLFDVNGFDAGVYLLCAEVSGCTRHGRCIGKKGNRDAGDD